MKKIGVYLAMVLFAVGCGCDDDADIAFEDGGTNDGDAGTDAGDAGREIADAARSGMDGSSLPQIDSGLDVYSEQRAPTLQDLEGTWIGSCVVQDGEYVNVALVFSGGDMNILMNFSDGPTCQNSLMVIDIALSVSIPEPASSPQVRGAYRLSFEVRAVTAEVVDEDAMQIANSAKLFGYSDWQLDTPKEVDGRVFQPSENDAGVEADVLPEIGEEGEFLFRLSISGNDLQISDLSGSSPLTDIYVKQ
ncbi:MAG: hypothetical protein JXA30_23360 [Deltaproteobacteria bacterium]|nr:hypothetical protein [Deltaproteobacteria bacterium]